MIHSILKNAKAGDVIQSPFPYLVLDGVLDPDLYKALENEYPFEYRIDGYSGFTNNTRYQISAVDGLRGNRLTPLWQEFVKYHITQDFFDEVATLFAPAIKKYYPNLKVEKIGTRFIDKDADMVMDCQPGINSPVKEVSSVKGPHLDHQAEFFAGLLYFRHPDDDSTGGELEIYRQKKTGARYHGARFIDQSYVEKVATISYTPNRLILFLNTIDSIHGVSPRSKTNFTRRLVSFAGEVGSGSLFDIPLKHSILQDGKRILRSFVR